MKLEIETQDAPLGFVLRQAWLDGEAQGGPIESFALTCGAGLGSPWMELVVKLEDGTRLEDHVDIRPLVTAWVTALVERAKSTAETTP